MFIVSKFWNYLKFKTYENPFVTLTVVLVDKYKDTHFFQGEVVTGEELGGAMMHCSVSGITDHFAQGRVLNFYPLLLVRHKS